MTECNRCGECCTVIRCDISIEEMQERNSEGWEFMSTHWREVSYLEASAINHRRVGMEPSPNYYYVCDQYDGHGSCLCQEEKPWACSGFPWYGNEPIMESLLPWPSCSFRADINEVVPVKDAKAREILVICASCKCVIQEGYLMKLEDGGVAPSHGICPACSRYYYNQIREWKV